MNYWHRHPTNAQEDRPIYACNSTYCLVRLERISRHNHRHACNSARPGKIFNRMVRWTKFAIGKPATHSTQFHICMRIGQVDFNLLKCSSCQKRCRSTHKRYFVAVSKTSGDTDHILLGDAYIDHPPSKFGTKRLQFARSD